VSLRLLYLLFLQVLRLVLLSRPIRDQQAGAGVRRYQLTWMALGLNVDCRSDEGIAGRDRARRHRQLTRRISERTETKQRRRTLGHTRHRAFAVGGEVVVIFGAEVVS
jgi:hypothetical protein